MDPEPDDPAVPTDPSMGDRFVAGVVLHTGRDTFELADRIIATPISALWS